MKPSNNDKMVAILRCLKPEMNGAVVGDMEARGVKYGLNYGVSVPVIRRVAREYAPDHALAAYLFRQDIRELKLAAVYIDDPAEVTAGQMEEWASVVPADEIMEHAAMNLFYASPDAEQVVFEWLSGDDRRRWKGALHSVGRAGIKGLLAATAAEQYLDAVVAFLESKRNIPCRAAVYALCGLARVSDGLSEKVGKVLSRLPVDANPEIREVVVETAALQEMQV